MVRCLGYCFEDKEAHTAGTVNGFAQITGDAPNGTDWVISTLVNPDASLDYFSGFDTTYVHTLMTVWR